MKVLLAVVLLFSLSSVALAQISNIEVFSTADGLDPYNPTVAINRKSPHNIVLAAAPKFISTSKDGGKSWQASKAASSFTGSPLLVSDRKGTLYNIVSYQGGQVPSDISQKMVCYVSKDGESWEEEGAVSDQSLVTAPALFVQRKSGEMILTWTGFDQYGSKEETHKSHVFLSRSNDGRKWSTPIQINQLSGSCLNDKLTPTGACAAISIDGKMFALWTMNEKLMLDRSYDKGRTWLTNDISIGNQFGGWQLNVPGIKNANGLPVFRIDNSPSQVQGSLYLLWADHRSGEDKPDVWFSKSVNFGDIWTTPIRVNDDVQSNRPFMPTMVVDETSGFIYAMYYQQTENKEVDVYLAFSTNGGNSFRTRKLNEHSFLPESDNPLGTYISLDAYAGVVVATWTQMAGGNSSIVAATVTHEDLVKMNK